MKHRFVLLLAFLVLAIVTLVLSIRIPQTSSTHEDTIASRRTNETQTILPISSPLSIPVSGTNREPTETQDQDGERIAEAQLNTLIAALPQPEDTWKKVFITQMIDSDSSIITNQATLRIPEEWTLNRVIDPQRTGQGGITCWDYMITDDIQHAVMEIKTQCDYDQGQWLPVMTNGILTAYYPDSADDGSDLLTMRYQQDGIYYYGEYLLGDINQLTGASPFADIEIRPLIHVFFDWGHYSMMALEVTVLDENRVRQADAIISSLLTTEDQIGL